MAVSRLSTQSIQQSFPKGNTVWDGTTATSSLDSLRTILLTSSSSSITFSNIPQTYSHLQIRFLARSDGAYVQGTTGIRLNGDSASNYSFHVVYGEGTTNAARVFTTTSTSYMSAETHAGSSATANIYGAAVINILDYTNTSKNKVIRSIGGIDNNGAGEVGLASGLWFKPGSGVNNDAVTSITIVPQSGNWIANSSFSLYGVK